MPAEPALPDGATIPQAATDDERAGLQAFLAWAHLEVDWGRRLAKRASRAVETVCR